MTTLKTQWLTFLKENPKTANTFDDWYKFIFLPKFNSFSLELLSERKINFNEISTKISDHLLCLNYNNADMSDIGNEIGFILGECFESMTEDEINNFITGFKHGVSLTNGTH